MLAEVVQCCVRVNVLSVPTDERGVALVGHDVLSSMIMKVLLLKRSKFKYSTKEHFHHRDGKCNR